MSGVLESESLVVHCRRNTTILTKLAAAYAGKGLFDKSLSFYQQALQVEGGKNAAIQKAIADTTLKKLDLELSHLDPKAHDYSTQSERIRNQRLEFQWHEMQSAG
jgi:hypothetical protein